MSKYLLCLSYITSEAELLFTGNVYFVICFYVHSSVGLSFSFLNFLNISMIFLNSFIVVQLHLSAFSPYFLPF